jgi:hypothetical protein
MITRMGGELVALEHFKSLGARPYLRVPPFCCLLCCIPNVGTCSPLRMSPQLSRMADHHVYPGPAPWQCSTPR